MKILMISRDGDGISLACKLKKEDNSVKVFCSSSRLAGKGFVDRVDSWRPCMEWSDLIVADGPGWGVYEKLFKRLGKPVFGISQLADVLMFDREKRRNLFSKAGMDLPRDWYVNGEDKTALDDILNSWTDPGVIVLLYGRTYVCNDPETFLHVLLSMQSQDKAFVRDQIEGIEVRVTGWFNGRGWMEPFYHGLMDMEESVGGMGRVGQSVGGIVFRSDGDALVERGLLPLTKALNLMSYRGPATVTGFVNQQEFIVTDLILGMSFDDTEAFCEGSRESLVDLLFETAQGVRKTIDVTKDKMAVIRVNSLVEEEGAPIVGLDEGNMKHLWMNGVYQKDAQVRKADGPLAVFKATAIGRDAREAVKRVNRTVERVDFLHKYYRVDTCQRAMHDIGRLNSWGLISD